MECIPRRAGLAQAVDSRSTVCVDAKADDILFLSDVTEELDAAKAAGMRTGLLIRPGNKPAGSNDHIAYDDFSTL